MERRTKAWNPRAWNRGIPRFEKRETWVPGLATEGFLVEAAEVEPADVLTQASVQHRTRTLRQAQGRLWATGPDQSCSPLT